MADPSLLSEVDTIAQYDDFPASGCATGEIEKN
jgi:hypothetical protein